MKTIVVYPIPFNLWHVYKPFVERFADRFKKYPPGTDYELYLSCHWGKPTPEIHELFYGTKARFFDYYRDGCDIGAAQAVSQMVDEAYIVGFPTHAYFHRESWLKRLVEAREKYGPGLYSSSGSWEGTPHLRTSGYLLDADLWRGYWHQIETRADASMAETGESSLTVYADNKMLPTMQVTWDGEQDVDHWRTPPGVFRNGDQNAMLCWDRHTDQYRDGIPDQRAKLEAMANGQTT